MSHSPIRVLLWSPQGSGEHYNGPASFTYRLYSSAPKGRVSISLVHGLPSQEIYSLFDRQHQLGEFKANSIGMLRFVHRGKRWIDNHLDDFDVMHSANPFIPGLAPAAHAQKAGLPAVVFVSIHNAFSPKGRGLKRLPILSMMKRRMATQVDGLIAMSQSIYDELICCGVEEEKIARIPMGVNAHNFRPPADDAERSTLRDELGWLDLPTLIFVGAVIPRKCPDLLVEAIGQLKKRGIDCQLVIVGPEHDPAYAAQIKDRAKALHVASQVIWFGFTRDIARLFRAANFFSLPSTNEGMAAALIEAMSSGLPAIVTPISGSTDAVVDGISGRLVPGDANVIADVLAEYILNPVVAQEQGRNAREQVLSVYSNERVFEAYESLFRRLMKGGSAAG